MAVQQRAATTEIARDARQIARATEDATVKIGGASDPAGDLSRRARLLTSEVDGLTATMRAAFGL